LYAILIVLRTKQENQHPQAGFFVPSKRRVEMANILKHKIDKDFTVVSNVLVKSNLSAKAKGIFVQLISLPENWCFSIAGLTALFTDKETSIKTGIDELVEAGFLKWEKTRDENSRFSVKVTTMYPKKPHGKISSGEKPTRENKDNKVNKNKINTLNKVNTNNSTDVELAKPVEYGDKNINLMFKKWEETTGYKITSNLVSNRRACYNLYRKHGEDGLYKLLNGVKLAQDDKYAPRISDFVDLQSKLNQLLLWGKNKSKQGALVL
jgi:hypothetical protein